MKQTHNCVLFDCFKSRLQY